MKFYRKQPIEAEQFDTNDLPDFLEKYHIYISPVDFISGRFTQGYELPTLRGYVKIKNGDWIVKGSDNDLKAITDKAFKQQYAELPVIPKNVAECIINGHAVNDLVPIGGDIYRSMIQAVVYGYKEGDIGDWIVNHSDLFARAWLDGYQVEEDK